MSRASADEILDAAPCVLRVVGDPDGATLNLLPTGQVTGHGRGGPWAQFVLELLLLGSEMVVRIRSVALPARFVRGHNPLGEPQWTVDGGGDGVDPVCFFRQTDAGDGSVSFELLGAEGHFLVFNPDRRDRRLRGARPTSAAPAARFLIGPPTMRPEEVQRAVAPELERLALAGGSPIHTAPPSLAPSVHPSLSGSAGSSPASSASTSSSTSSSSASTSGGFLHGLLAGLGFGGRSAVSAPSPSPSPRPATTDPHADLWTRPGAYPTASPAAAFGTTAAGSSPDLTGARPVSLLADPGRAGLAAPSPRGSGAPTVPPMGRMMAASAGLGVAGGLGMGAGMGMGMGAGMGMVGGGFRSRRTEGGSSGAMADAARTIDARVRHAHLVSTGAADAATGTPLTPLATRLRIPMDPPPRTRGTPFEYILSLEQRRRLVEDGFLVVPGVVPKESTDVALRAINYALGQGTTLKGEFKPVEAAEARGEGEGLGSATGGATGGGAPWMRMGGLVGPASAAPPRPPAETDPAILQLVHCTRAWGVASDIIGEGKVHIPRHAQIALRFPQPIGVESEGDGTRQGSDSWWHIDGMDRGTAAPFTLLFGVMLNDVDDVDSGNLGVYPGSHRRIGSLIARDGAAWVGDRTPRPALETGPHQVLARRGDLVIAHPLTAHRVGRNYSPNIRYCVYFRLQHIEHELRRSEIPSNLWALCEGIDETAV